MSNGIYKSARTDTSLHIEIHAPRTVSRHSLASSSSPSPVPLRFLSHLPTSHHASHSPSPPIPSPCPRPTFDPFLLSPPLSIPVGGDQLVANKRNSSCCSRCFHFLSLLPSLPSYVDYNGIGTGLNLTSLRPPLTLFRVLRPSCHP